MKKVSRVAFGMLMQMAVLVSCLAASFPQPLPGYTPPPGWAGLSGPGVTVSPPGIWQRRTTDIYDLHVVEAGAHDITAADVAQRWKVDRLPPGQELLDSTIVREPACAGPAWWIRQTFGSSHGNQHYRIIMLEFKTRFGYAVLKYDLRSNAEEADPAVLASFIDYCKHSL